MDETRIVGQKWLVDELVLPVWAFRKCASVFQSDNHFESIVLTDNDSDRQTDNVVKTIFSHSKGLKTSRIYKKN